MARAFFHPRVLVSALRAHARVSRAPQGILERMKEIEEEMQRTQKNKARGAPHAHRAPAFCVAAAERPRVAARQATSYHLGRLKAQMAKLRTQLLEPAPGTSAKTGDGFEARPARAAGARLARSQRPADAAAC